MPAKEKNTSEVVRTADELSSHGRLSEKICLITGGAGNIGEIITKRFLDEGAVCIITGRNQEKLQNLKNKLFAAEKNGRSKSLHLLAFNAANPSDVHEAMQQVKREFGRIDVLVNNAGTAGPKQTLANLPFTQAELEALRQQGFADTETVFDAVGNILGITWLMTRAAFDVLSVGASVINVSTIFSRTEYFGRAAYSVPKSALENLAYREKAFGSIWSIPVQLIRIGFALSSVLWISSNRRRKAQHKSTSLAR